MKAMRTTMAPVKSLSLATALALLASCGIDTSPSELADVTTPDLTIAIEGTPQVVTQADGKHLVFNLRYRNVGSQLTATVRSKALLIPQHDFEANPGLKGTALPPVDMALNLATGATVVQSVNLLMPNVPAATYFLGAVTDTQKVLPETFAQSMNNTAPDLVNIGNVVNQIANDTRNPLTDIDVYHEVHTKFDQRNGRASHRSRMIMRGNRDTVNWSTTIYARFMIADLVNAKLFMSAYNTSDIDKKWSAISWNAEKDATARAIAVDYYTNQPTIDGVLPGRYVMAILLNSRDLLPEAYPENNLDLTAFTLEAPALRGDREIWLVKNAATTNPSQSISFQSPLDVGTTGRPFAVGGLASWFSATATSGTFTGSESIANPAITLAANLAAGEYSATLSIIENGVTTNPTLVPVHGFVHGTSQPALSLATSNLTFTSQQGLDPAAQTLAITNTGSAPLKFSLSEDEPWLAISPSTGTVAAGQTLNVSVRALAYAQRPNSVFGQIRVFSNASNVHPTVSVNHNVQPRN